MRDKQTNGSKVSSDLLFIGLFISINLYSSIYFDIHEKFMDFVEVYESWELDEIISSGAFAIAVSMAWYGSAKKFICPRRGPAKI